MEIGTDFIFLDSKIIADGDCSHENKRFLILGRKAIRVCGAADPSQGPWEPGALRAALSLGGQATAGGALH